MIRSAPCPVCRDSAGPRLVALAVCLVAVFVRLRLIDVPLDRDEGEYALTAWLLTQGVPPYLAAYTMKLPGMAYLWGGVFGK